MITSGVCKTRLEDSTACTADTQCKNKYCIHDTKALSTCKPSRLASNSICFYDMDCQNDLGCSKSLKKCISRATLNNNCSDVKCAAGMLCNRDYKCQQLFSVEQGMEANDALFCKTGRISENKKCLNESELPILQMPIESQYLPCTTDGDCVYKFANGTLAEVGIKRCYYSSWTENPLKYCRYGGGEDKLIKSMKSYISKYSTSDYDMDSYAYKRLSDPIERVDFINPGPCSLDYYIKNEYGSATDFTAWVCTILLMLMLL